jgi:hypothetical protein
MLRSAVLGLGVAISIVTAVLAGTASYDKKPQRLRPGEAFVIARLESVPQVASLRFKQFHGRETFSIHAWPVPVLLRVKPGQYYLEKLESPYDNSSGMQLPEPADAGQAIVIREAAVTYIGDWSLNHTGQKSDGGLDIRTKFDETTVLYFSNQFSFPGLILLAGRAGANPKEVDWPMPK